MAQSFSTAFVKTDPPTTTKEMPHKTVTFFVNLKVIDLSRSGQLQPPAACQPPAASPQQLSHTPNNHTHTCLFLSDHGAGTNNSSSNKSLQLFNGIRICPLHLQRHSRLLGCRTRSCTISCFAY
jgi:hypothetical protein